MVAIQPIKQLVLLLAGKILRREPLSENERRTLDGFRQAFPDLKNPVHIYCTKNDHRTWGILLYDVTEALDGHEQLARADDGQWICKICGNGASVRVETVRIT